MLISCPYCGERDLAEFAYGGDASRIRPDLASADQPAWNDFVYGRANPLGAHREFWQHAGGCRAHLLVVRDTQTNAVSEVRLLRAGAKDHAP